MNNNLQFDKRLRRDIRYAALPGRIQAGFFKAWVFICGLLLLLGLTAGALAYLMGTLH